MELQEKYKLIDNYVENIEKTQSSLINVLHYAQNEFGYLSKCVMDYIAEKLNISTAKVYGVVSFYSYFTTTPKGENVVDVCMGTACYVKGSGNILAEYETKMGIKAGETSEDGKYSLRAVRCVGACGLAPVVNTNDKIRGNYNVDDVKKDMKEMGDN